MDAEQPGLGSRALLDKIDKLRELGVSSMIPLPQVCIYFPTSPPLREHEHELCTSYTYYHYILLR